MINDKQTFNENQLEELQNYLKPCSPDTIKYGGILINKSQLDKFGDIDTRDRFNRPVYVGGVLDRRGVIEPLAFYQGPENQEIYGFGGGFTKFVNESSVALIDVLRIVDGKYNDDTRVFMAGRKGISVIDVGENHVSVQKVEEYKSRIPIFRKEQAVIVEDIFSKDGILQRQEKRTIVKKDGYWQRKK